ncbi:hypothetical protein, partial [Micromonospora sp. NPDC000121]|uniref:hypothetical protein n=1 Tax=Micromonospora sp. NPDC000121 TaxID=3364214 RepID=UPI0036A0A5CD
MTWALVPLIPKEETAARHGRSPAASSTGSDNNRTPPSQSTNGDGSSACSVLGNTPACNANTIFIT